MAAFGSATVEIKADDKLSKRLDDLTNKLKMSELLQKELIDLLKQVKELIKILTEKIEKEGK